MKRLCFILMPFGTKTDAEGRTFQFDEIYRQVIRPAVEDADMEPVRADEEQVGGLIHKPMLERLVLCKYAIADLTAANANVFYELGIRHASRPSGTVLLFAEGSRIPFDLGPVRGCPYPVTADGLPDRVAETRGMIAGKLAEARQNAANDAGDSPVFQLLDDMGPPDISRLKTDVFRERVQYAGTKKTELASARREGSDAIDAIRASLGNLADQEAGLVVDLLLSYRAVSNWPRMIELVGEMPETLRHTVLVREQHAFALNRNKQSQEAEEVLVNLIEERGASSETFGLLGRIYKDRWDEALQAGNDMIARGFLKKAIETYLKGFEADSRDAFPGINAVTLMELAEPPDPRREALLPVVTYACRRRIEGGDPDYWDHATLLELAVLARDPDAATDALGDALAAVREPWEPETTARNLRLIQQARQRRGDNTTWEQDIISNLSHPAH